MSVEIVYEGPIGGQFNKVFADTLLSPDQPQAIGTDWITAFNLIAATTGGTTISSMVNRSASGLVISNNTGAGYLPSGIGVPIPLYYPYIRTRNQFCQATFVSELGIADLDLAVVGVQNTFTFYGLNLGTGGVLQWILYRRTNAGDTTLIPASVATAFANGDVMRIEADISSLSTETVLTIKKNGTQVGTFTDNTGSRLSNGIPFLYINGSNPAANIIIRDFSCGVI